MNRPESLPAEKLAMERQRAASRPTLSIWVGASAGTGKTRVLTDRVLNLMLGGTDPARILCLTFTRAAAAEMETRLAGRLAKWATVEDARLADDLKDLTGTVPARENLDWARQLFARALDAPGGMKIQTIHAFCQSLLRRFPIEAGLAPHFELIDERGAAERLIDAREEVLKGALGAERGPIAQALAGVTAHVAEAEFIELMRQLATERARLAASIESFGGVDAMAAALRRRLGVAPHDTPDSLLAAACADDALDLLGLRLAAAALADGSDTDRERGAVIAEWLADPAGRAVAFDRYRGQFLTAAGALRTRLITRGAAGRVAGAEDILRREAERLLEIGMRLHAATLAEASRCLFVLAEAMLEAYRRHKEERAALDYEDLILGARALLTRAGVAPWVLYKLDGGIDHILIDEAQDTSPAQWDIVAALAEEFFAGTGAREIPRTVFAVGDFKQSIFSFQGADPRVFAEMREHFRRRAGEAWDDLPLDFSFRSTPAVLAAVDAVFARAEARDGVVPDDAVLRHHAVRTGQAGLVELWPPAIPPETEAAADWSPPTRQQRSALPRGRLARLMALRIARMLESRELLESKGRPIEAGDIMVLVRRRDALVEELVRELKQRGVPVAGVDRMLLVEQMAVMDLVALGRFLLMPEDDLTLATVLKSPLVGLDEDALFALAHERDGRLWNALRARRAERPAFESAETLLSGLLARADFAPPYELFAEILGPLGGRRKLVARLGPEALDPIDEFMTLALQYERDHVPSLQGFLHWLEIGGIEVKRDLDQEARGQVRIMTVHGAKGLQAPIVFLPDTMQVPQHAARLLWCKGDTPRAELPLWSPRVDLDEHEAKDARNRRTAAEAREHRRLLYVAMTRAEDRLYVCGWRNQRWAAGCWHELVEAGLGARAERFEFDCRPDLGEEGWAGPGLRLVSPQSVPREIEAAAPARPLDGLPSWAVTLPRPEAEPLRPLMPSRPLPEDVPVRAPLGADQGFAFHRGRLIHRLLELLPEFPRERWEAAGRRFLARPLHGLEAGQQAALLDETVRVLDDPTLAPLFGPGSLAEVPLVGEVRGADGRLQALSGRLDRLLVTASEVLALDYKTNRPPPVQEADIPEPYLRQMAAYRAALVRIYPGIPVCCALLWTDGPRLMVISAGRLDRYMP